MKQPRITVFSCLAELGKRRPQAQVPTPCPRRARATGGPVDDFGQREQTDQNRNEVQTRHKGKVAKDEPVGAIDQVQTHSGQDQTQTGR